MNRHFIISLMALAFVGCAAQSKQPAQRIPPRGTIVAQGAGQLSFRSPSQGMVSVYDVNLDSIVHSSVVNEGSLITLNPQTGNITISETGKTGSQVVNTGVSKSHRYEFWFIPQNAATTQWAR